MPTVRIPVPEPIKAQINVQNEAGELEVRELTVTFEEFVSDLYSRGKLFNMTAAGGRAALAIKSEVIRLQSENGTAPGAARPERRQAKRKAEKSSNGKPSAMVLDLNDAELLYLASEKPEPLIRPELPYCVAPVMLVVPFCNAIQAVVRPALKAAGRDVEK
jgi:hypothetical protein